MERWQDILRTTLLRRRTRIRGPFYATGWLSLKAVSVGKWPNEKWPDVYVFFVGLVIWLAAFAAIWISN